VRKDDHAANQSAAPGLGGSDCSLRGIPIGKHSLLTDGLPLLGGEPDDLDFYRNSAPGH